jgi:hypothetical protein
MRDDEGCPYVMIGATVIRDDAIVSIKPTFAGVDVGFASGFGQSYGKGTDEYVNIMGVYEYRRGRAVAHIGREDE